MTSSGFLSLVARMFSSSFCETFFGNSRDLSSYRNSNLFSGTPRNKSCKSHPCCIIDSCSLGNIEQWQMMRGKKTLLILPPTGADSPRGDSADPVSVYCRRLGGLYANDGWWMWRFNVDGWWMWALLCIDVALQWEHSTAYDHCKEINTGCSGRSWKTHVGSQCVCASRYPSLFLSFSPHSSQILLLLLPAFLSSLPDPKVRLCDIISLLPALLMMWKWRRGKWVAGTSRWCCSGCTAATKPGVACCYGYHSYCKPLIELEM